MDHRKCSVPGCTENADTFQSLPKEPNTRRDVMFVYEKIPVQFDPQLHICLNHEDQRTVLKTWDNVKQDLL